VGEVNEDNVTSGFKVRVGNTGCPVPHYFQMDKDGDAETKARQGTISVSPGAFQVSAGELCGKGVPGVYIDANNGDLVLKSNGRIRLIAQDIDLIAKGAEEKNGNILLLSNSKVVISSKNCHMDSQNLTKIFSEKTTEVIGNSVLNLYGDSIEMLDSTAGFRGSTGFLPTPWTPREFEQVIANMKRVLS
jgi:hypothetical protein